MATARCVESASVADTVRVVAQVLLPTVAGGVIKRRPAVMALTERRRLDHKAVRLMTTLRRRYGLAPLRLPHGVLIACVAGT